MIATAIKTTWSVDRLIFMMVIPIPGKTVFLWYRVQIAVVIEILGMWLVCQLSIVACPISNINSTFSWKLCPFWLKILLYLYQISTNVVPAWPNVHSAATIRWGVFTVIAGKATPLTPMAGHVTVGVQMGGYMIYSCDGRGTDGGLQDIFTTVRKENIFINDHYTEIPSGKTFSEIMAFRFSVVTPNEYILISTLGEVDSFRSIFLTTSISNEKYFYVILSKLMITL